MGKSGRKQKAPAFQFYPMDFLASAKVQAMTPAERGDYVTLLCRCFLAGGWISADPEELAEAIGCDEDELGERWTRRLQRCFSERDGQISNERMLLELGVQEAYRDKLSDRGGAGATARWGVDGGGEGDASSVTRSERLKAARELGRHSESEWLAVRDFFGQCVACGAVPEDLEGGKLIKDHIVPIYLGGSDAIQNIQPSCRNCNSSKGPDQTDHRIKFSGVPLEWLDPKPGCPQDSADRYKRLADDCQTPGERLLTPSSLPFPSRPVSSRPVPSEGDARGTSPAAPEPDAPSGGRGSADASPVCNEAKPPDPPESPETAQDAAQASDATPKPNTGKNAKRSAPRKPPRRRWKIVQGADGVPTIQGLDDRDRELAAERGPDVDLPRFLGHYAASILQRLRDEGVEPPKDLRRAFFRLANGANGDAGGWLVREQAAVAEGRSRFAAGSPIEAPDDGPDARLALHRIDLGSPFGVWPISRAGWSPEEDGGEHWWIDRAERNGERFYVGSDGWVRAVGTCGGENPPIRRATIDEILGIFAEPSRDPEVGQAVRIQLGYAGERGRQILDRYRRRAHAKQTRNISRAESSATASCSDPQPLGQILDSMRAGARSHG